ncbi:serine/threonine-protein kinase [Planotetraspora kaengkrachanensis]|uniref:Protein kinase domain-containing protein n=1 Tax=Planotetraspora kaengkrachanensis TaxID=575193 RepID=A0A8J3M5M8_9ACTN|nr:serine/threonine-protein kinase [Planotetraspora kaengkrachanensis]GIG79899.1 hypothetical protein Pka01_30260 [Planotetraspora kaengkrachanensis]
MDDVLTVKIDRNRSPRPPGAEPLRPGDPPVIGPYRLLGRLGEGGMGTVYLALAPTGRMVAVKVVKAEFTQDESFAARFHAEVDNARKVASFCTAQVLDNGDAEDGRPYMVTEYIAGVPLSRQIAMYGPLEPGALTGVALGVTAALAAIHVAGLVHRDLKPANVILSISGPRVIDFGISRALDATHGFTRAGELLGSPGWWAPEQVRGDEVTQASDVFAWGCLVAYAGSGRRPYGDGDALALVARALNSRPDLGSLPAPLDELTRRATHPDPSRRPSAQDLLIALVGGVASAPAHPISAGVVAPAAEAFAVDSPPTRALATDDLATEALAGVWEPPAGVTQILGLPSADPAPADAEPAKAGLAGGAGASPVAGAPSPDAEHGDAVRRTKRIRVLAVAASAVIALTLALGALITLSGSTTRGTEAAADTVTPSPASTAAVAKAPAADSDVGRRLLLAGSDTQLLVPQQPRCGLTTYEDITSARGGLCLVRWTMVNLGGDLAPIGTTPPRLVDDAGGEYPADEASTLPPTALVPGGKVDGVLIFDLPSRRTPVKLVLADDLEVRL